MIDIRREIISALAFLILSILLYTSTTNIRSLTEMGVGPDFAPKLVAIGMFILSLVFLIKVLKDWKLAKKEKKDHRPIEEKRTSLSMQFIIKYKGAFLTIGLIALYIFIMPMIGFLLSTILYLFTQFCLLGERKYWNIPLFSSLSLIVAVTVYFIFRFGFELRLPAGIIG